MDTHQRPGMSSRRPKLLYWLYYLPDMQSILAPASLFGLPMRHNCRRVENGVREDSLADPRSRNSGRVSEDGRPLTAATNHQASRPAPLDCIKQGRANACYLSLVAWKGTRQLGSFLKPRQSFALISLMKSSLEIGRLALSSGFAASSFSAMLAGARCEGHPFSNWNLL